MDIGIIGGGAIGLLFAAYISEQNHQVTVYTRSEQQASLLKDNGINKTVNNKSSHHHVQACCITDGVTNHDLVIIAVKQYHIQQIQDVIHTIDTSTPIMFIQNGMSHIDLVKELPHQELIVGVVEHGALKENANCVLHTGVGVTKLSTYKGNKNWLKVFTKTFSSEKFQIIELEDWYEMLIGKVVVNAMINPLTALFRIENGQLMSNPYFHSLFKKLFDEIISLLNPVDPTIWWDSVLTVCEKTAHNRSSMLRDIEQKNQTEIESILGYLKTLQKKNNNSTPIIDFLYYGIKGLEK